GCVRSSTSTKGVGGTTRRSYGRSSSSSSGFGPSSTSGPPIRSRSRSLRHEPKSGGARSPQPSVIPRGAADVVVFEPFAGPLYSGEGVAGGAELQSFYLARSLATAGFRVRHVVSGIGRTRTHEGVELVPLSAAYGRRGIA